MRSHVASLPTLRHHHPFSNIHFFFSGRVEGRFEGLRLPLLVDSLPGYTINLCRKCKYYYLYQAIIIISLALCWGEESLTVWWHARIVKNLFDIDVLIFI